MLKSACSGLYKVYTHTSVVKEARCSACHSRFLFRPEKMKLFKSKLVTSNSDKNKMLKRLYIQNSRKHKEDCNEDLAMSRYRISKFKKLAGTVSCNIHTVGNNLRRQNK